MERRNGIFTHAFSESSPDLSGKNGVARADTILQLIAECKQNKEIANLLNVSVKTVEFHRGRLMNKIGTRTVAELAKHDAL